MSTVQEIDPAAVAIASVDTISAGDVDASLATFADDAVVNILLPGAPETYTGKEEIRAWLESLAAQHWEGEVEILQVEGDTVTTRLVSRLPFEHRECRTGRRSLFTKQ